MVGGLNTNVNSTRAIQIAQPLLKTLAVRLTSVRTKSSPRNEGNANDAVAFQKDQVVNADDKPDEPKDSW